MSDFKRLYEDCLEHMAKMNARIKGLEAALREAVPCRHGYGGGPCDACRNTALASPPPHEKEEP